MTAFAEEDNSIFSETSEEWGHGDQSASDYHSSDDYSSDDQPPGGEDSIDGEELMEDEYNEGDRLDRSDRDEEYLEEKQRYRLLTITALSCLLTLLMISFGLQLKELYKYDTPTPTVNQDGVSKFEDQISPSGLSRILDMLSSDPSKRKQSTMSNVVSDEFTMPNDATRIYTHTSLTSKNYRAGGILSDDMLSQYERDGVLVIRNLIPPKLLDRLDLASDMLIEQQLEAEKGRVKRKGKQFHLVKNGAIFLGVPPPPSDGTTCSSSIEQCAVDSAEITSPDDISILSSFRDLAMYSKIPRVAASLLRLDEMRVGGAENLNPGSKKSRERNRRRMNSSEEGNFVDDSINLRICRDIFLTKDDDTYACGWHVDDTGFWPSVASDAGVNAWIALDDMPWPWSISHSTDNDKAFASGKRHTPVATFALALGSHRASFRHDAYHVTGSTHTQPPEGFQSAADLVQRRTGSGTCNIKKSSPDLYKKLDERKVVYDLKKGDVIFHDRWVFHRTVTVDEYNRMAGGSADESQEAKDKIFRRYSIRYSPGSARVPPGYGFELSALYNPDNANSTLDEIVERDGPFYPKVWPHVNKKKPGDTDYNEEIEGLTELVYEKMPRAEQIQKERKKEVNRLLSSRGKP